MGQEEARGLDPGQVQDVLGKGEEEIPKTFLKLQKAAEATVDAKGEDEYGSSTESIPVIDMAALVSRDVDDLGVDLMEIAGAEEIVKACKELGFLQVVNHGVSYELVQRMQDKVLEYFTLPVEDRVMDWAILPPIRHGKRDWNDALIHFNRPPKPDAVPRTKLPEGYRETLDQCVEEVLKLTKRVQRVLSVGLGLSPTRLEEVMGEFDVVTRVNYYPRCPQPDLVRGMTSHSDFGILTVLSQNDVEGLQVLKDGLWRTVKVVPNSLVLNVADMFEMTSNGTYVSCEHRARANPNALRFSIGWFMTTKGEVPLGPLPELLDEQHPPVYNTITMNEYMRIGRELGFNSKSLLDNQRTKGLIDNTLSAGLKAEIRSGPV